MAINYPNFLGAPVQPTGFNDIVGDLVRGYQAGAMPRRMRLEEEQRRKLIEQMVLANQHQAMENKYQEPGLQQGLRKGALGIQEQELTVGALPQRLADEALARKYGLQTSRIGLDYLPQEKEADLAYKKAQTETAYQNRLTPTQRELSSLYGYGTPEYQEALKNTYGIMSDNPNAPPGSVPFSAMPANSRNSAFKEQQKILSNWPTLKKGYSTLEEMETLINRYPNMSNTFTQILANPADQSIKAKALRVFSGKAEREAVEKMSKLGADLELAAGQALGSAYTDARSQIIARSKASAGNTDATNKMIIKGLKEFMYPQIAHAREVKKAAGKYYIPPDYDAYPLSPEAEREEKAMKAALAKQSGNNDIPAGSMVEITDDETGQTMIVTIEKARQMGAV